MSQNSGHDRPSSSRVGAADQPATGTTVGADTTARMSGTAEVGRPAR
jgi:hypothetical protein